MQPVAIPEGAESARYPIQAVERALSIIHLLADSPGLAPLGVTEIAKRLGVSKSTAHRLLSTLVEFSFVTRDPNLGKYRLGWALYQIAHHLPHATGVHAIAQPLIREASAELGETVNLAVRYEGRMVVIDSEGPTVGLKVDTPRGVPYHLHTSAIGKALLLDFDGPGLRDILGPGPLVATTGRSITTVEALQADLAASRRRGYTFDDEESIEGVHCLGVPVRDNHGRIVAATSVTGPSQRLAGRRLKEAATRVRRLGLEISRLMGFAGKSTV